MTETDRRWNNVTGFACAIIAAITFGSWQQSAKAGWFMFFVLAAIGTDIWGAAKWVTHWHKHQRP